MFQRAADTAKRFQRATRLDVAGMIWLGLAASVLGGSLLVLTKASEDVVRHNGLALYDPTRLHWFILHRPAAAVSAAKAVTMLGSAPVLIAVVVGAAGWLWLRRARLVLALAPMLALGIAGIGAAATKAIVGRPRPPVGLHLVTENEPSFPSGHTTDATAVYLTLALIVAITVLRSPRARVAIVAAALALSGAVGLSRLTLGVHWPSDVIAGWALGTMVATAVSVTVVLLARCEPVERTAAPTGLGRRLHRLHRLASAQRTNDLHQRRPTHPGAPVRSHRRLALLAAPVALVAIVTACGSDKPDATSPAAPSKASTFVLDEWSIVPPGEALPAGENAITATNEGSETHELVIIRAADAASLPKNADGSVDEEATPESMKAGEIADLAPGKTKTKTLDLAAGDYIALCNIVESMADGHGGSGDMGHGSGMSGGSGMGDGGMDHGGMDHVHFELGMVNYFTVA